MGSDVMYDGGGDAVVVVGYLSTGYDQELWHMWFPIWINALT